MKHNIKIELVVPALNHKLKITNVYLQDETLFVTSELKNDVSHSSNLEHVSDTVQVELPEELSREKLSVVHYVTSIYYDFYANYRYNYWRFDDTNKTVDVWDFKNHLDSNPKEFLEAKESGIKLQIYRPFNVAAILSGLKQLGNTQLTIPLPNFPSIPSGPNPRNDQFETVKLSSCVSFFAVAAASVLAVNLVLEASKNYTP